MENSKEYFNFDFYKEMIYDEGVFDIAKLLDLAAIYGNCNTDHV